MASLGGPLPSVSAGAPLLLSPPMTPVRHRARFWWRTALLALITIYATAWPLQFALDFLRSHNLLRLSMAAVFLVVAFALVLRLIRLGGGWREWLTLSAAAVVYAAAASRLHIVQERLHLVEYGALALIFAAAFAAQQGAAPGPRQAGGARRAALFAFLATAAAGTLDEILQGVLPNRQFDVRDLLLNALSGALALGAAGALGAARRRDRAAKMAAAGAAAP